MNNMHRDIVCCNYALMHVYIVISCNNI